MKNIHYQKRSAVEQNNVAADYHVLAIRRRRRQLPLQVARTMHNHSSQAGGQSAADDQLALKTGREPVTPGKSGRQMIMVLPIPTPHFVAIMVGIRMTVPVPIVVAIVFPAVIAVVPTAMIVLIVTIFSIMTVPMLLGNA
jgi:hypothetical protein